MCAYELVFLGVERRECHGHSTMAVDLKGHD